uniref:NADH-ubiquinone oxidoreductase chain 4 n=1 Tax=Phycosecis limbata TaxID=1205668 RepID=A0A0S2MR80_9CUCU|nr:NADH deshydrogenase subunit 4 [Phycosecis limbata]
MMSMLMFMIMLIPLIFLKDFWLIQFFFLLYLRFMCLSLVSIMYLCNLSYWFGWDLLSFTMIMLSIWICSLMVLASSKLYFKNFYFETFLFMNLVLLIILFMVFSSLNLFVFYLFFEMSLIPVLFMILGWGYQPERIQAGTYLLFYTLLASLPMMISIFYLYGSLNSMNLFFFKFINLNSVFIFMFMNMVFFIKIPMYFVHLWLPKAHVEAPISGSMILAGVMLKLGGYGLMRLMVMFLEVGLKINYFFIVISLVGGFFISLICICQSDLKSLIAYSSVAHMGLALSGILTLSYWGMVGGLLMMIAHGLCSSGLFCLANINYERVESRSIYVNKGMINLMPSLSLWWFLFCSSNMAAPPSLNLLGEIVLINSLISWSFLSMLFLMLMSFFSAVYSLYLFSFTQHGKLGSSMFSSSSAYVREFILLMLHWLPLNLMVIKGEYFSLWL